MLLLCVLLLLILRLQKLILRPHASSFCLFVSVLGSINQTRQAAAAVVVAVAAAFAAADSSSSAWAYP